METYEVNYSSEAGKKIVGGNSSIYIIFEFLTRADHLRKIQFLSWMMFHKKVPYYFTYFKYGICYFFPPELPKFETVKVWNNAVRNMDAQTHKYRGKVVHFMNYVSIKPSQRV